MQIIQYYQYNLTLYFATSFLRRYPVLSPCLKLLELYDSVQCNITHIYIYMGQTTTYNNLVSYSKLVCVCHHMYLHIELVYTSDLQLFNHLLLLYEYCLYFIKFKNAPQIEILTLQLHFLFVRPSHNLSYLLVENHTTYELKTENST